MEKNLGESEEQREGEGFKMTEDTQLQPVRQAAAMHMNRLLQAAAVSFQVCFSW